MKLRYDDVGTGEPTVLLHGLGGTANVWGTQVAALSPHFRVLVPDLRGCGGSHRALISMDALVDDVVELIDDNDLASVHLVGHSLGSVIVQHLATKYPRSVRSIALIGPFQIPSDAGKTALASRASQARSGNLTAVADATVQAGTSAETRRTRPEIAAFVRELVARQDGESYAQTCEALMALAPVEIDALRCPTLVITGDQDRTAPPAVAKSIAEKIPGAAFSVLSECGHWTPLEKAAEVSALLRRFLCAVS